MERIDGLEGPLIVLPQGVDPLAGQYDEEKIIFLTDWWARGSATSRMHVLWVCLRLSSLLRCLQVPRPLQLANVCQRQVWFYPD